MRDDACCRSGVYERRAVRDRARREHVTARRVRRHGRGRVCHLSASFGGTWISIQPLGRARRKAPLGSAGVQCPRARRRIHRPPARPAHMRALVSVPSIRPTTPRSSTRRRRDTPATRRGFGGRRVLNNPTRAVVHSDATPRLPATAGGFFGDLDVAARTETRAAPAPHVVDRPPPGVVDHFPPPPVPHDEALSPFGPLEPEHGASHTRTSTHARHPHTIRIILTRPIDKHLAFMPAHAPAQHCALTELAVSKRAPKATTRTPRKRVNYSDLVFKLFRRTRETCRARPPAPSSRTCTRSPASPVDSCYPAISCCGWRTEPRRRGTWTRRRLRSVRSTGWRPRRVARA